MKNNKLNYIVVLILGMTVYAIGSRILTTFIFIDIPEDKLVVDDWEQICFWLEDGNVYAFVSPRGCYSTSCTTSKVQAGTAILDRSECSIKFDAQFLLTETSRFPLPCSDNCAGGGAVLFNLGELMPNKYDVWFENEKVGDLMIFSGRPTPRQCFDNSNR